MADGAAADDTQFTQELVDDAHHFVIEVVWLCLSLRLHIRAASEGVTRRLADAARTWLELTRRCLEIAIRVRVVELYLANGQGVAQPSAAGFKHHASALEQALSLAMSLAAICGGRCRAYFEAAANEGERVKRTFLDRLEKQFDSGWSSGVKYFPLPLLEIEAVEVSEMEREFGANLSPIVKALAVWAGATYGLTSLVEAEYREVTARLNLRPSGGGNRGGRPRDEQVDKVIARCWELKSEGKTAKEIHRIVNSEFGCDKELSTIVAYLKPSYRRKRG